MKWYPLGFVAIQPTAVETFYFHPLGTIKIKFNANLSDNLMVLGVFFLNCEKESSKQICLG